MAIPAVPQVTETQSRGIQCSTLCGWREDGNGGKARWEDGPWATRSLHKKREGWWCPQDPSPCTWVPMRGSEELTDSREPD